MLSWLRHQWTERVSYEGGLSLLWMVGLLLIPLIMAAFFYPLQALLTAAAVLLVSLLIYEGMIYYRRHHVPHV